jgi:hypothetical protein
MDAQLENRLRFLRKANTEGMPHSDFLLDLGKDRNPSVQHRDTGEQIPLSDTQHQDLLTLLLANFLPIVLGAPVGEELFFRGLVLRGFLSRYSVTKAVWASALLWAVSHLNPWQAVGALPLGLVLAWLVVRTGSLIPAIIGHMIANFSPNYLFPPLALALGHDPKDLTALELGLFSPPMLAIGGAMAGIGGFVLWRQLAKLPNDGNV